MTLAYILIATLHVNSPQGRLDIPLRQDFPLRSMCIEHLDMTVQSARRQFRGTVSLTILAYCDEREVRK